MSGNPQGENRQLLYDPFLWLGEIAGMRSRRKALLGNARGRVVETGAGTGLNAFRIIPTGSPSLCSPSPMRRCAEDSSVACSGTGASRGSSTRLRSAYH
jgi:hypothetical protein